MIKTKIFATLIISWFFTVNSSALLPNNEDNDLGGKFHKTINEINAETCEIMALFFYNKQNYSYAYHCLQIAAELGNIQAIDIINCIEMQCIESLQNDLDFLLLLDQYQYNNCKY